MLISQGFAISGILVVFEIPENFPIRYPAVRQSPTMASMVVFVEYCGVLENKRAEVKNPNIRIISSTLFISAVGEVTF